MDLIIIFAAKYLIIVPVLIALYLAWQLPSGRRISYAIHLIAASILAYITAKIASHFYYDARPFVTQNIAPLIPHAADNGFPSDHTLLAGALAAVVTLFNRNMGIALWVVALIIGSARVAAHVHHPIDILGSLIVAVAATAVVTLILKKKTTF